MRKLVVIIIILLSSCQMVQSPLRVTSGPLAWEEGGRVTMQIEITNVGTAYIEGVCIYITVSPYLEDKQYYLGNFYPAEVVVHEFTVPGAEWGESLMFGHRFEWE